MKFYQKANTVILEKCSLFIKSNQSGKNNHDIYKRAINLSSDLIDSLLESEKSFNDEIKKHCDILAKLKNGPEKETFIGAFNKKEICLVLDQKAEETLKALNIIIKNNT
jgi:hypothetical protein